jgi:hypothetical protein
MDKSIVPTEQRGLSNTVEANDFGLIAECWGLDEKMVKGINRASSISSLKHGMMAQIPIRCYGEKCPYAETCYIPPDERPANGRCPVEVAAIMDLFDKYCHNLGVTKDDIVDIGLIKELVDLDIQLVRADNRLAASADFVEEVVTFVTNNGQAYTTPQLNKAVEYKDKIRRERHRILQLLNSTRKDRESGTRVGDPSTFAAALMAKARELEKSGKIRTVIEVKQEQPESKEGDT